MEITPRATAMSVDLSTPPGTETDTLELSEAYKTLFARIGRKSPKIPADLLVRHVLECVPAGEWPVRLAKRDVSTDLLDLLKRTLASDPQERPADGAALAQAIDVLERTAPPGVPPPVSNHMRA